MNDDPLYSYIYAGILAAVAGKSAQEIKSIDWFSWDTDRFLEEAVGGRVAPRKIVEMP